MAKKIRRIPGYYSPDLDYHRRQGTTLFLYNKKAGFITTDHVFAHPGKIEVKQWAPKPRDICHQCGELRYNAPPIRCHNPKAHDYWFQRQNRSQVA